jgi:PAS domain S-box-containing protein
LWDPFQKIRMKNKSKTQKEPTKELEKMGKGLAEFKGWKEKYKSLVKASPFAITITDLEGRITDVSSRTLKLHGYRGANELIGKSAFELIAASDRKKAALNMKKTFKEGYLDTVEYTLIKKDGTQFVGELVASLIKDSQGKPEAFIATTRDITKRREAERAIKHAEERYRALFDRSLFCVFVHDFEGNFIDANRAALDLLGYKRKDISSLSLSSFLDEEQMSLAIKTIAEIRKSGFQRKTTRYKLRKRDGEYVWAETEASLIYKQGAPYAILGIARDITDEMKAEEALRESEKKYRDIFESLYDVYYRTDKKGMITEISPSVRRQAGYDPEDVIGRPVTDFYLDPSTREVFAQRLQETGSINDYELRLLAKDGRVIEVSVSSRIVCDEQGLPMGVEGVLRNITTRKQAEKALRESETKFRSMVEHSIQGIFTLQDFHVVYANEALAHIIGYSVEELLSMTPEKIRVLVHPEDQDLVWGRMRDRLEGKKVPSRYEFKAIRKDGVAIWAEMISSRIDYRGKPAIQGAIIDITDRKQAEVQIRASLREKEVMLREIHHRVKNNMQIILSLLRIQSRLVKEQEIREMFKQSQNRIRSMALIHEALYKSDDLANIDFSDYLSRMTTHLLSLYREEIGQVRISQEAKDIFLNINKAIPCGLIISELISNALKHAFPDKRDGEVSIEMREDKKGKYTLVVKDNGVGFPAKMDFRAANTLGLQLVNDLVSQLNGRIDFSRKEGTEFTIRF